MFDVFQIFLSFAGGWLLLPVIFLAADIATKFRKFCGLEEMSIPSVRIIGQFVELITFVAVSISGLVILSRVIVNPSISLMTREGAVLVQNVPAIGVGFVSCLVIVLWGRSKN